MGRCDAPIKRFEVPRPNTMIADLPEIVNLMNMAKKV